MPRYKLLIEYDGTPFAGWQIQANGPSVQGALTDAISALCGEKVHVQGAGRTDAGVHALGQVAHVDLAKDWPPDTVRDALNAHLRPHPVAVLLAERVADDFDARFSAIRRHYRYRIINRRADLALEVQRAWRVPRPLNATAMHDAAQRLVGRRPRARARRARPRRLRASCAPAGTLSGAGGVLMVGHRGERSDEAIKLITRPGSLRSQ